MKNTISKNENIEIIMPPLIGDCIMTFPLINQLKYDYDLTLVCNEYVFESINYLQYPLKSKLLSDVNFKSKIIIDFLSNDESSAYLQLSNPKFTVGFKDGPWPHDLLLKQPAEFISSPASSIFLYALEILRLKLNSNLDFSCAYKWHFSNQSKILIAPSTGNISRCYSIDQFIRLAEKLGSENIAFFIGPNDKNIRSLIPLKYEIIETTCIKNTIAILSQARVVVASEGGFMHISASYGIPLLGLFKVASKKNWFPYYNKYQIAIGDGSNNYIEMTGNVFDLLLITEKINEIYEEVLNQ